MAFPRLTAVIGASFVLLGGCRTIGPHTIARDRFEYSGSISESWQRQTLLNIVKLRYLDLPTFVDVGQIVAGYSLETGLSAGASFPSTNALGGTTATLGGSARFTDRPTITYTPLTGNRYVKSLMTPLPPSSVFFMIQSGWPADGVLLAAVASVNGLRNQGASIAGVAPPDPDFIRVLELFRKIQLAGGVGMRVRQDVQKAETTVLTFQAPDIDQATLSDIQELRLLLRLDPEAKEFTLAFGGAASSGTELAVLTRSVLHIMGTMAAQVEVPAEDVAQGRATPGGVAGAGAAQRPSLAAIHSSKDEPTDASVAVRYRNLWFWIDDRDLKSKRAFAFMLMLFTLADTGEKEALPLITIPAQ